MPSAPRSHVVAIGGAGFSVEDNPAMDDFVLSLTGKTRPKVCFVPTASGDNENYIVRFYKAFSRRCEPTHLELFRRNIDDLVSLACEQDVLYVGGGNTANMIAVWRLHGFDTAINAAAAKGVVLAGISAGSLCWFDCGVSDSFGSTLTRVDGLSLLTGSNCPFYDTGDRRSSYHRLLREGMTAGVATELGVALHYTDGALVRVVSSRPGKNAYRVAFTDGEIVETPLAAEALL